MTERQNDPSLDDLLADRVTEGLGPTEEQELANFDRDDWSWEHAACLTHIAFLSRDRSGQFAIPEDLHARVLDAASTDAPSSKIETSSRLRQFAIRLGGIAALLVVSFWLGDFGRDPTPSESREAFLANSPEDVVLAKWFGARRTDYEKASGDIAWSSSRQGGFLRLVGLPPNDPKVDQYQLWILDPEREGPPVDGGVFDAVRGREVVVEFKAKERITNPMLFALSREVPGGVKIAEGSLMVFAAVIPKSR